MGIWSKVTFIAGLVNDDGLDDDSEWRLKAFLEESAEKAGHTSVRWTFTLAAESGGVYTAQIKSMDEDAFAAMVLARQWEEPENVVLVIEPEEGPTRVFRPVETAVTSDEWLTATCAMLMACDGDADPYSGVRDPRYDRVESAIRAFLSQHAGLSSPLQWSTRPPTEPGGYWLTMPPATYFAVRGASGYDRPTLEELAADKDGHLRTMRGEGSFAAALTSKGGRWMRVPDAPPLPEEAL